MMPERATDTNPNPTDAEKLARFLELELMQKRAEWKQAGARRQNVRLMSFVFLFLIIAGCLVGLFFAFPMVNGERPKHRDTSMPASARP